MELPLVASNSTTSVTTTNNDILLALAQECTHGCCISYSWQYTTPTPALEQRGLTPSILRNEIHEINERMTVKSKNKCSKGSIFMSIIGFVVFVIGLIILFTDYITVGVPIILVGVGLVTVGLNRYCGCFNKNSNNNFLQVQEYVECDLNEKYQKSHGIRFSMILGVCIKISCIDTFNQNDNETAGVLANNQNYGSHL
eukprot:283535_1